MPVWRQRINSSVSGFKGEFTSSGEIFLSFEKSGCLVGMVFGDFTDAKGGFHETFFAPDSMNSSSISSRKRLG